MDTQTIVFIGPQGSGKGTQAGKITEYLTKNDLAHNVVMAQTGKGFRELREQGSYTGVRVKALYDSGGLLPDFLTEAIVVNQLTEKLTSESHIVMDGFPRNIEQAQFVDRLLEFYLRDQISVIHLDTPEDVVKERMLARGRVDDHEASIIERLRLYHKMTEPLVAHYQYRPNTKFITLDGSQEPDLVEQQIREGLGI